MKSNITITIILLPDDNINFDGGAIYWEGDWFYGGGDYFSKSMAA